VIAFVFLAPIYLMEIIHTIMNDKGTKQCGFDYPHLHL